MTVALLAQRRTRGRRTALLAVALAALVVIGAWATARTVQGDIAVDVARTLGSTDESIRIEVDGRDVTLIGPVSDRQRANVAGVAGVGQVVVQDAP